MVTLDVVYGIDFERERLALTLKKKEWYESSGYKITLPQKSLEEEFQSEEYETYKQSIMVQWLKYLPHIESLKDLPFKLKDRYTIVLTKYGVGGSYSSTTGQIVVNIAQREKEYILGTLIHEMIHISIEPLIQKYQVHHWQKERLVDLICDKYFSDIREPQSIKEDVSIVDRSFKTHFPNLNLVAKSLSN